MSAAAIVVAGFGRCGTSLVMQMLAAGGVPCLGLAPTYEDPRGKERQPLSFWTGEAAGKAIKVLDPHRDEVGFPPASQTFMIWMNRYPSEQAKSHAKFSEAMLGVTYSREKRRQLERMLIADRARVYHALRHRPAHLMLQFEAVLESPLATADALAAFVGRHDTFNRQAAAAVVVARQLACLPDMGLELDLVREAERLELAGAA